MKKVHFASFLLCLWLVTFQSHLYAQDFDPYDPGFSNQEDFPDWNKAMTTPPAPPAQVSPFPQMTDPSQRFQERPWDTPNTNFDSGMGGSRFDNRATNKIDHSKVQFRLTGTRKKAHPVSHPTAKKAAKDSPRSYP